MAGFVNKNMANYMEAIANEGQYIPQSSSGIKEIRSVANGYAGIPCWNHFEPGNHNYWIDKSFNLFYKVFSLLHGLSRWKLWWPW